MNNWLCEILEGPMTGEQFFVQTDSLRDALTIAASVVSDAWVTVEEEPYSDFEAEMMGLDTY